MEIVLNRAARFADGVDKDKVMDLFQDQQFDDAIAYLSFVDSKKMRIVWSIYTTTYDV